ncbi:MAG: hypothetical protein ACE5H9_11910 [Anaerolineae bacterium]
MEIKPVNLRKVFAVSAADTFFNRYFFLTLALTVFAVAPLLYPGYFETHTGFGPVWNVMSLRRRLADFGWLPALAVDFDPWRGAGLLPYYLAALVPLAPAAAVKLVMGAGLVLGAGGLFLWLQGWLGRQGATLAALVYTYLPFTLATVYVRGAWGEALFWGLAPWGLLAATALAGPVRRRPAVGVGMLWLGLGLSQLGLSLWLFLFLAALLLVLHRRGFLWPLLAAVAGLALAAALTFARAPDASGHNPPALFAEHLVYPAQLFSAFWGFGVSRPGWDDGLSLGLGLAAVGLSLLAVYVWRSRRDVTERRPPFFLAATLVILILITPLAAWLRVWSLPGLAATLSYPWQLLGLAGLCLAALSGVGPRLDDRLRAFPAFAALLVFTLLAGYPYLEPRFTQRPPGSGPQAILGHNQVAVLDYDLNVEISGGITGLDKTKSAVAVADYGPPQPGDVLRLQVHWQALQPFSSDMKVFVHLVDAGGKVLAQVDLQPQDGAAPTRAWIPGHTVEDTYRLTIPGEGPDGPYRLYLGLYRVETLERLPVAGDDQGRVIIGVP